MENLFLRMRGNINYGYFGSFCNIPKIILIGAAGVAQILDENAESEDWMSFYDDPRDSYRVMQGIDIYNWWH